jgi:hypothetical protein
MTKEQAQTSASIEWRLTWPTVMPDWRGRQSLPDGTVAGRHRGGGSHHKDVCLDLPHSPLHAMEEG